MCVTHFIDNTKCTSEEIVQEFFSELNKNNISAIYLVFFKTPFGC